MVLTTDVIKIGSDLKDLENDIATALRASGTFSGREEEIDVAVHAVNKLVLSWLLNKTRNIDFIPRG